MPDITAISNYIKETSYAEVITNGLDGYPNTRLFGSFVNEGLEIYISSQPATQKTKEIETDNRVTVFLRHDGQKLETYYTATIFGKAVKLAKGDADLAKAFSLLGAKNPGFAERLAKNGQDGVAIYKIKPVKVKIQDFSKGRGAASIEEFTV
ncbi:hypothetical protein FACS189479_07170 [Spirochaetia bacterium]|nr:hypothetical protein FACS189479_07170 [Spirochaetia bacterium]